MLHIYSEFHRKILLDSFGLPPPHTTTATWSNGQSSVHVDRLIAESSKRAGAQTALLLCVADSHPGIFKTLAACKLENTSSEFGEDSIEVWAAITVRGDPLPP